jgi:hypothetical protein
MDFFSAIQNGIKKSEDVKRARLEIQSVINDVSDAILKYTKGELKLIKYLYNQKNDRFSHNLPEHLTTLKDLKSMKTWALIGQSEDKLPEKLEQPNSLVLIHPKQRNPRKKIFAKWSQDPSGYPCIITSYYGFEYICSDKSELNSAFVSMLMHPDFNELIRASISSGLSGPSGPGPISGHGWMKP